MPQEDVTAGRIKQLRKQASLTQAELAAKVGLSRAAISQFEAGDSKPAVGTLMKLADALGINLNDLVSDTYQQKIKEQQDPKELRALDSSPAAVAIDLPFIPLSSRNALTEGHKAVAGFDSLDRILLYISNEAQITDYENAVVLEVGEDNMEPLLHSGDKVIAWPVPESEWEQVYNKVCVVAYKEEVTIKAVRENELPTKGLLTLYAQNTTAGFLSVQRQQIKALWKVEEFFERPKIRL